MYCPYRKIDVPFVPVSVLGNGKEVVIVTMTEKSINSVEREVCLELSIVALLKLVIVFAKVGMMCDVAQLFPREICSIVLCLR